MLKASVRLDCDGQDCMETTVMEIARGRHHVQTIPDIVNDIMFKQGWHRKYIQGEAHDAGYYCPVCSKALQQEKEQQEKEEQLCPAIE